MKKCSKCKIEKSFQLFSKDKITKDGYRSQCKSCNKEYKEKNKEQIKQYYENNKDYFKEQIKLYKENNKEKIKYYSNEYQKQRRQIDPIFKLRCAIRKNICMSFKRGTNQFRKDARTEKILGCTIQEFIIYIESKFTKGMTLENHGEWHLDHIQPISLAQSKEEIIKLNHYTNFQPLWAEENIRKGNRLDY